MTWQGRYVNLDRAPERRVLVEEQIAAQGLQARYRRFAAVDGRLLGRVSVRSAPEVGIFRSHMQVLAEAAAAALATHVIEDDVLLCDLTAPVIERTVASGALERFDVVFLETYVPPHARAIRDWRALCERCTGGRWPIDTIDQVRLFELGERYYFGATSYLVGPRGAGVLLGLAEQEWTRDGGPTCPFDDLIQRAARAGRLRIGCLLPFVTAIDLRTAQDSSAERVGEDASAALLQRLLRHSFYARRDLDGYVIPRLDALLAGLRTQPADPTMAVDLRVLEVLHRLG